MRSAPLLLILALLPACASQKHAAYEHALTSPRPPDDFWLSVTVLRAPAEAASRAAAYQKLPIPVRPARYIVEADEILRASTGSGADETTFPPPTRQLTDAQFHGLWNTLRESSLVHNDNPALVAVGPSPASIGDKTVCIVSFNAAGTRRVLSFDSGDGDEEARKLVEQLAALAWVQ